MMISLILVARGMPIGLVWWLVGLGVIVSVLVVVYAVDACVGRMRNRRADEQYRLWRANVEASNGELSAREVSLNLKKGEVCFFHDPTATLCEPRVVRSGGYGGASVRVARGVSIHAGRFGSESHDEWRAISAGALYVTNERIVFDGATKNRIVRIKDIMSVVPGYREAVVNSEKLQKPMAFASINGQIFADVVNAMRGA